MKKIKLIILLVVLGTTFLAGCSQTVEDSLEVEKPIVSKEIKISIPDGLPSIAIAKLAKENLQIK